MPCSERKQLYLQQQQKQQECIQQMGRNDRTDDQDECSTSRKIIYDKCFRGIHDNLIQDKEINMALMMGEALIKNGGDHFDVQFDVSILHRRIPSIVQTLRTLLDVTYIARLNNDTIALKEDEKEEPNGFFSKRNNSRIEPVAFRILTTGPMDGNEVNLSSKGQGISMYRIRPSSLNETTYLDWVKKSRIYNERVQSYFRPWPFRSTPKRDTCDLKFDLQGDSRFCIRTSIFLKNGAGEDYQGGCNLFVDNHASNYIDHKRRIARGVSIDGSRGRIVVNTGGSENMQCRFPTRAGLRSVLQIWWDCDGK